MVSELGSDSSVRVRFVWPLNPMGHNKYIVSAWKVFVTFKSRESVFGQYLCGWTNDNKGKFEDSFRHFLLLNQTTIIFKYQPSKQILLHESRKPNFPQKKKKKKKPFRIVGGPSPKLGGLGQGKGHE